MTPTMFGHVVQPPESGGRPHPLAVRKRSSCLWSALQRTLGKFKVEIPSSNKVGRKLLKMS